MDVKKDILWRVYLSFIALVILGVCVMGRVVQLQFVQGKKWRNYGDSTHRDIERMPSERGTIYSEDMEMLSSSIPFFDVHIDFRTAGLRAKNGELFYKNIDSLSYQLATFFGDKTKAEYKQILTEQYKLKKPYYELVKKLNYKQYFKLRTFPLVRLGANKSGFLIDVKDVRMNPFGLMANRTIGLSRDPNHNVGLEKYYDSTLTGQNGTRVVQFIAGGVRVPINGTEIEPINGKDIVTTLSVQIQDITQNALKKMMEANQALSGTAIVMEVATGKIKAIANLGKQKDGSYKEDNNYALIPSEPGSTIKVVTLMAGLEDNVVNLNTNVVINGGHWNFGGRSIVDAERSPKEVLNYKEALVHSSNVAMAKLAALNYAKNPTGYIKHFTKLHLTKRSGLDLSDPYSPLIKTPKSTSWSNQTLASMGFGYELRVSPLQTLMVYNAIANNGKMMQPYLVTDIKNGTEVIKHIEPKILENAICKPSTLSQLQEALKEVTISGTAKRIFDSTYLVAGKTGTAQVDDGNFKYSDGAYQSSFVGYFPADKPRYSIIVVIKNKPHAAKYFGGQVSAPVFKEISDQLVVLANTNIDVNTITLQSDSSKNKYKTATKDAAYLASKMSMNYNSGITDLWSTVQQNKGDLRMQVEPANAKIVPNVLGMGLKDALNTLENKGIMVKVIGKGKVVSQNVVAGTTIAKNMNISILLN